MNIRMESETQHDIFLDIDREDLLAILQMRFEEIPTEIQEKIENINSGKTLERLILVAANAASWEVFIAELESGNDSFKMIGEAFNPLSTLMGGDK